MDSLWMSGWWLISTLLKKIRVRQLDDWWYTYPSEKQEFVNWDDYSQYMEKMEK